MKRLLRNFAFTFGAILTVVLVVVALAAPLLSPYDPNVQDTSRRLEAPSREHLLGLDDLGPVRSKCAMLALKTAKAAAYGVKIWHEEDDE